MEVYLITGASRGLGAALFELLDVDGHRVYSISRSSLENKRSIQCDLSDPIQTSKVIESIFSELDFPLVKSLTLVNNAGMLGPVGGADKLEHQGIIANISVNLVSPIILSSLFIQKAASFQGKKLIVNISSGAAVNPYDGWSLYCASKAALEHHSRCLAPEQKKAEYPTTIINVNPGPMNTGMQDEVRSADEKEFSKRQRFIDLKKNGQLSDPDLIAELIVKALEADNLVSGESYKLLEVGF